MSEPKKFNCESARPDDYICTEVSVLLDKMRVSILQEGKEQWVMLRAENARAFAAEIIRIADEIDPPKKQSTQHVKSQLESIMENNGSVKPVSTKKPIEFEARRIGAGHVVGLSKSQPGGLCIGPLAFADTLVPELRQAIDEYEAAVKKANTLTLGDLAVGDWFELAEKENALAIPGPLFVVSHGEYSSFGSIAGHRYRWEPSTPVRRLKATFEVVE